MTLFYKVLVKKIGNSQNEDVEISFGNKKIKQNQKRANSWWSSWETSP